MKALIAKLRCLLHGHFFIICVKPPDFHGKVCASCGLEEPLIKDIGYVEPEE